MKRYSITICVAALSAVLFGSVAAFAQTSSFTYQGKLTDGGNAANGSYDLVFGLWDQDNGGNQFSENYRTNVNVVGGIFTVELDFGSVPLTGADRWISINVKRSSQTPSEYVLLLPRQKLSAAPYAVKALSASNNADADPASATPSVANLTMLTLAPTTPTTITDLINGSNGQCVDLLAANDNVTIISNTNFKLGTAWTPGTDDVMTVCRNSKSGAPIWYERSRSNNTSVTLTVGGGSNGNVTSGPPGINCGSQGSECVANFPRGSTVTLFASPDANSYLSQWVGGACPIINGPVCTFRINGAGAVFPNFFPNQYQVSLVKTGNGLGTVTGPGGLNCGATCTETFSAGTSVTLTPSAGANSVFLGWSGDSGCSGSGTCFLTVNSQTTAVANFSLVQRSLTITKSGTGANAGTVTSLPSSGESCGTNCSSYDHGTVVVLTAVPGMNSTFTGWGGECSGVGLCIVTMDRIRSVAATFTTDTNLLTVTKMGGGTGSVVSSPRGISCGTTCTVPFDYGTMVTLRATADPGSVFTGWSGDCVGTDPCSVTMDAARSVVASFESK